MSLNPCCKEIIKKVIGDIKKYHLDWRKKQEKWFWNECEKSMDKCANVTDKVSKKRCHELNLEIEAIELTLKILEEQRGAGGNENR